MLIIAAAVAMIAMLAELGARPPNLAAPGSTPAAAPALDEARAAAPCSPFPDVNGSNQHCRDIGWLRGVGLTRPSDGLYHSGGSVTRGSMTAFLFRLVQPGKPQPRCTSKPFPDVPTTSTYCGYIAWAKQHGIAHGYSDGTYRPGNAVTRGAMATYLFRIANPGKAAPKCTRKPFRDVAIGDAFCGAISWMVANGITKGVGDGTNYGTTSPVTRGAMASFLRHLSALPGAVSDGFVLSIDGRRAVVVSLKNIRAIPRAAGAPAAKHRYLQVTVNVRGYAGLDDAAGRAYRIDTSHWTITANGASYRAVAQGPMAGTLGVRKVGSGGTVAGTLVFDAPAHGTLTLTPSGYDPIRWKF